MVTFNFEINTHGKHMTSIVNEVAQHIRCINDLAKLEDGVIQSVLASGFEINYNFCDKEIDSKSGSLWRDIPVEELELSIRTNNCLRRAGIETLADLREANFWEVVTARNLGTKSLEELARKILETERNMAKP